MSGQSDADHLNAAIEELACIATSTQLRLPEIVSGFAERESYFLSSEGPIIRVLRSDDCCEGSRPAYLQFYAIDGTLLDSAVKSHESSGLFFAQFSSALNHSKLFKLSKRPSFIARSNQTRFEDVSPVSPLKSLTNIGGDLDSHDFG